MFVVTIKHKHLKTEFACEGARVCVCVLLTVRVCVCVCEFV